jgi:uncharacterized membrane protein HdeD (DUF308 family)
MSFQPEPAAAGAMPPPSAAVRRGWVAVLVFGIVLVLLGTFAVAWSYAATWALIEVFSIVLLLGSGAQLAQAVLGRGAGNFVLHLLIAALYFIAGAMMLRHPVEAAAFFTLMLAAMFLVGGTLRVVVALTERFHGWGWVLLNGVITLVLGALIWRGWPETSFWVIGLFVGIDMLFNGWSLIMLALAVRGLTRPTV